MTSSSQPKSGISIAEYVNTWGKIVLHNNIATAAQWSSCIAEFKKQGGKLPIETIVVMLDVMDDQMAKLVKARAKAVLMQRQSKAGAGQAAKVAAATDSRATAAKLAAPVPDDDAFLDDVAPSPAGAEVDSDPDIIAALGRIADGDDTAAPAAPSSPPQTAGAAITQSAKAARPAADDALQISDTDDVDDDAAPSASSSGEDSFTATMDADDELELAEPGSVSISQPAPSASGASASRDSAGFAPKAAASQPAASASASAPDGDDDGRIELAMDDESNDGPAGDLQWAHEVEASEIRDIEDMAIEPPDDMWEALFSEAPLLVAGEGREHVKAALRDEPGDADDDSAYELDIVESDARNDHLSEVDWADGLIGSQQEQPKKK